MAGEGGVVMTTFPRGGVEQATGKGGFGYYFNEVWTGQEHQLAAHMIWEGMVEKAFVITRILHDRHHAARRNPYNEVECSDHYTRAMSSHGSFIAACGYEYHGPKGHLGFAPRLTPERFKAPFTAAEGWGTFQQAREGAKQVDTIALRYGRLRLKTLAFAVPENQPPRSVQVRLNGRVVNASLQVSDARVVVTLARTNDRQERRDSGSDFGLISANIYSAQPIPMETESSSTSDGSVTKRDNRSRFLARISLSAVRSTAVPRLAALGAAVVGMLLTAACPGAAEAQKPAAYVEILHQLTDLDRLTLCRPAARAGCFPVGTATSRRTGARTATPASTCASSPTARR